MGRKGKLTQTQTHEQRDTHIGRHIDRKGRQADRQRGRRVDIEANK